MAVFKSVYGDILESPANAITIPVNMVHTMGAGLARQAIEKWPYIEGPYMQFCDARSKVSFVFHEEPITTYNLQSKNLKSATAEELAHPVISQRRTIVTGNLPLVCLFATKAHWRNPSTMTLVESGLRILALLLTGEHSYLRSIALPQLGCGLGGLSWKEVRPMIIENLRNVPQTVYLYE